MYLDSIPFLYVLGEDFYLAYTLLYSAKHSGFLLGEQARAVARNVDSCEANGSCVRENT
jgi:hypothetical protein